jgi:hypothetical protein
MKNVNINNVIQQGTIFIKTITKCNNEENAPLLTAEQWGMINQNSLPPYFSDDYSFILYKGYHQYLLENKDRIEKSSYELLLNDTELKQSVSLSRIFVTVQKAPMQGNIQLVLKTDNEDDVTLCDIKDVEEQLNLSKRFINQQVNFASALNEKTPNFCIHQGQKLLLRITGGFLLKDNILVCSQSL